jgi:hypothetical protein
VEAAADNGPVFTLCGLEGEDGQVSRIIYDALVGGRSRKVDVVVGFGGRPSFPHFAREGGESLGNSKWDAEIVRLAGEELVRAGWRR